MDAVEYIKTRCRLCKSKDGCSECPLRNKEDGRCIAYVSEYAEKAVQIVEEWAKEHPAKTRQSEFLRISKRRLLSRCYRYIAMQHRKRNEKMLRR